jgi:tocopherol cyclase
MPLHALQTPHSGYHWDGYSDTFFEGWYFRLTLPHVGQSFAFMYSIQDPTGTGLHSGCAAQILGWDEQYLCRPFPWGRSHHFSRTGLQLGFGCSGPDPGLPLADSPATADRVWVTATQHCGVLRPPTGATARWSYDIEPVYGWGVPHGVQKPTAGWLSALPIFEPGWQVLLAHGLAKGWIEWNDSRYEFQQAPVYAEKNWGRAFPEKWFWLQCNAFAEHPTLAITAAGGKRQVLWWMDSVAMIGIHYQGQFYAFASTEGPTFGWRIQPWGEWHLWAENDLYRVEMYGWCDRPPAQVRVPTAEGLVFACRDTTAGQLSVSLWQRASKRQIVSAHSGLAGLETGGPPWAETWCRPSSPNIPPHPERDKAYWMKDFE